MKKYILLIFISCRFLTIQSEELILATSMTIGQNSKSSYNNKNESIDITNNTFQNSSETKLSTGQLVGRVALGTVSVLCLAETINLYTKLDDAPSEEGRTYIKAAMYGFGALSILSGVGFILTF